MPRWGMVIDMRVCNGCGCCAVSCTHFNRLPDGLAWRQVPGTIVRQGVRPRRLFLSMSCMHCAHPPCLDVCPTGATVQRDDGIVNVESDRCMGCGYCVVACPYFARTLAHASCGQGCENPPASGSPAGGGEFHGVCTKCNLCLPRLDAGIARGLRPGIDPEASPMCSVACLSKAIHFGDLDDPDSNVGRLLRARASFRVHEELGTRPSVFYLTD